MMMILYMLFSLIYIYNFYKYKYILSNFINLILFYLIINYDMFIEWNKYSFNFSLNNYSFMLIILSLWIFSIIIISLNSINYYNLCINFLVILLVILILFFMSNNILLFYFFFEISLILMFLMIIYWGMGEMRILASMYLLFYTLFFSLPFLLFLFLIIKSENYIMFNMMEMKLYMCNKYLFVFMILSFLVKIPIFSLHIWLLKAHVEAPVFCSMILASIMLKLGTYGLLRFILIFYNNMMLIKIYVMIISLIGGIILSILCLRQIDMKILIAYSSVVHMSILISSLMTLKHLSLYGCYLMMIAHGLCSSGLFYMVNMCYKETNSRLMIINKGMMSIIPKMSLLWFLLCSSNMSAPLSLNLISEIFILMVLYNWCNYLLLLLMLISFLSFIYSLYLFSYINHGMMNFYLKIKNPKFLEFFVIIMHWLPLNFMFLNLDLFM
uniref:NADH-ubiquinone oxidoreductase chain 4 n=1 Tax=Colletes gigas TaxID=935657 RepID=A0A7D5Q2D5_9HYME|nr:NADH dehydrogenase subunit 4 [Colletes gigas]